MEEIPQILKDINDNKCILFLGPQMTSFRFKGKRCSISDLFCSYIIKKLESANIIIDENAHKNPYFLTAKYINSLGGRTRFEKEIEDDLFSLFDRPSSVYYYLSKLPFNTIINFGSDRSMQRALNRNGFEFHDKYYDYNGADIKYLENIDDKLPLVYNLLGSVKETQSQILTEEDQLNFLKRIVSGPKLPDNLLSRFKEKPNDTKSYIFLGFNFEEWPFRFLLDVLQLPKAKSSASPKLSDYNVAFTTKEFYQERFGLKFIDQSPEEFSKYLIDAYHKEYGFDTHKNGFILYHESEEPIFNEFKEFLATSKLGRRIKFWDKSQELAGDIKEKVFNENLHSSTVFIFFLSTKFLNSPTHTKALRSILSKPDSLIFPIKVKNCEYDSEFPELDRRASLFLPSKENVLVSATNAVPSAEDYIDILKKINSKIR